MVQCMCRVVAHAVIIHVIHTINLDFHQDAQMPGYKRIFSMNQTKKANSPQFVCQI